MSEQSGQIRTCPACGSTVPTMARYCPRCGMRLTPPAVSTLDNVESARPGVLDTPIEAPAGAPVIAETPPVVPAPADRPAIATPLESTVWTASASNWAEPARQTGTWASPAPATTAASPRGSRTKWIILAILGFLVFCCCGLIFVALLVDGTTSKAAPDMTLARHVLLS